MQEIVMTSREVEAISATSTIDLVHQTVLLKLEAGFSPEDAMLSGYEILDAWVQTKVNGEFAPVGAAA